MGPQEPLRGSMQGQPESQTNSKPVKGRLLPWRPSPPVCGQRHLSRWKRRWSLWQQTECLLLLPVPQLWRRQLLQLLLLLRQKSRRLLLLLLLGAVGNTRAAAVRSQRSNEGSS